MTIRRHALRSCGRGWGALVCDEIRDREIGFVADPADDGDFAGGDRARNCFFVERPQVFETAAPAAQDQYVAFRTPVGSRYGLRDLLRAACPLYRCGINHHRQAGHPQP